MTRKRRVIIVLIAVALLVAIAAPIAGLALARTGRDPRILWYVWQRVDTVRVVRVSQPWNVYNAQGKVAYIYIAPPFVGVGADPHAVQALYDAAFAERVVPPDATFSCPDTPETSYHLTFQRQGQTVLTMDASPAGCQFMNIGGFSARFTTDDYWQRLAQALGVPETEIYPVLAPLH